MNNPNTKEYPAVSVQQPNSDKKLILFSSPCVEVQLWAGVPQKKSFGEEAESVGFQRQQNDKRIEEIKEFLLNDQNIIQNPLLCTTKQVQDASVEFLPDAGSTGPVQTGFVRISFPDYSQISTRDILGRIRANLEERVPELADEDISSSLLTELREQAAATGLGLDGDVDTADDEQNDDDELAEAASALFDESHIRDFWEEIAARHMILTELNSNDSLPSCLGFDRASLVELLKPVVLVDGQHRLRGATSAAREMLVRAPLRSQVEERILAGESAAAVEEDVLRRNARQLPISLLLSDDPAEQVFQFIVVNQKATPVGRALLGTIISTTLSRDEMESVANRLKDAGIPLEESQAITYLARHHDSPFYGLIERGLAGNGKDLLQWGVAASLVAIFRELRGGKLFGQRNDYAEVWKSRHLSNCGFFDDGLGADECFGEWRRIDGPWRSVFMAFFSSIRDRFADTETEDASNYWGKPRVSNLFNKTSLTILSADFFQFLVETRASIEGTPDVALKVADWLMGVNPNYFNRDWNLEGVKKDSSGIQKQWAYQWTEYRKNPSQLPQARVYRNPRAD